MSSSGFSSALKLVGLNDFVTPTQACIKPVKIDKKDSADVVRIEVEADGTYSEVRTDGTKVALQKAKITLNDCLACSGCITTAETVLVEAQSVDEFLNNIRDRNTHKVVVITVSPQALSSLAQHYKLSLAQCYKKINTLFLGVLKCDFVFDSSFSRDFSLLEQGAEFVAKYRAKQQGQQVAFPLLTSACPGWICYAEKTHGDYILPHISTAKSPQQVMGTLVKHYLPHYLNNNPSFAARGPIEPKDILHVCIMPCFDKKLEASRDDFYNDILKSRDVDLVLTSIELPQLVQKIEVDFASLPETQSQPLFNNITDSGDLIGVRGGSGGYLEFVFRYAAKELFNVDVGEIQYKVVRNNDFKEVELVINGSTVLAFALAYGFRNIQTVVRQVKQQKCKYDFIEIMACPSGCLNGGAQIRAEAPMTAKEVLKNVESIYEQQQIMHSPEQNPAIVKIYNEFLGGHPYSEQARRLLHTQYHRVAKLEITNPLAIQW